MLLSKVVCSNSFLNWSTGFANIVFKCTRKPIQYTLIHNLILRLNSVAINVIHFSCNISLFFIFLFF